MDICRSIAETRATVGRMKAGGTLGFVPTMGALHDGHLSLVAAARAACPKVIASVFVNPTQFERAEDLANYPRDTDRDLGLLEAAGVDAVFMPDVTEMYPEGAQTVVEVAGLGSVLMGALRPGHFRGVTTVVSKLFNIVQPDRAFFGEKDFQQLAVIRQMVRDLAFPVEIVGVPIMREADGLAMSSRNVRLTPEHRAQAVVLNRVLDRAEALADAGPVTISELDAAIRVELAAAPDAQVESVDIQDPQSFADLTGRLATAAVILLAVRFGPVLLIDARVVVPG